MSNIHVFTGEKIETNPITLKEALPGVLSGVVYADAAAGLMIGETCIGPKGGLPGHKGNQESIFIVVAGSGTIYTESDDGQVLDQAEVAAGDVLHYTEPFFNHRYAAGEEGLAYMVIPIQNQEGCKKAE